FTIRFETRVAPSGPSCGGVINFIQISDHGGHRRVQTVQIQPVESHLSRAVLARVIVVAEPADKIEDVGVAPPPRWKTLEACERIHGIGVVAPSANVAVDSIGVRPVGLDGDRIEALLDDQALRDLGPLPVELMRSVRRLANEHETSIADQLE